MALSPLPPSVQGGAVLSIVRGFCQRAGGMQRRSQVPRVSLGSGSRREGSRPLPVITFLDEPREDFRGQADPTPALGQPDRSSRWDTERLSSAGRRRDQTPGKPRNRPTKRPRQRASAYGSKYICISLAKVLLSLLKVPVTTESGKVLELRVYFESSDPSIFPVSKSEDVFTFPLNDQQEVDRRVAKGSASLEKTMSRK